MPGAAKTQRTKAAPTGWAEALTLFGRHLVETEKSPHTQANYRESLLEFGAWYRDSFGELPVPALIDPGELRAWKSHLRDQRHLEPATVNRRMAALRSFLRFAEDAGIGPAIAVPKPVRTQRQPPRWLNTRQQHALVRAARRYGSLRDLAVVQLLLNTGLRVEELIKLRWRDITLGPRSGRLVVREGKGRKQRPIELNIDARQALRELQAMAPHQSPQVIHGKRGPLTISGVQQSLAKLARVAGLDELSPHVLRHTFGHNLAVKGVAIQVIADLMGHESLETTRRYVQPGGEDLAAAVERLAGGDD
jgi:site-specific recombinase XerD